MYDVVSVGCDVCIVCMVWCEYYMYGVVCVLYVWCGVCIVCLMWCVYCMHGAMCV